MKEIKIKKLLAFLLVTATMVSCLKKNASNIDIEDKTSTIMELQFIQPGGSTINSGMQYFSGGALTYPGADISDTANINVSIGIIINDGIISDGFKIVFLIFLLVYQGDCIFSTYS